MTVSPEQAARELVSALVQSDEIRICNGGGKKVIEAVAALIREREAALVKVLKPFAEIGEIYGTEVNTHVNDATELGGVFTVETGNRLINVGQCRQAAQAIRGRECPFRRKGVGEPSH